MMECFHCGAGNGAAPGRCTCILCASEKMCDGTIRRIAGPCVACKGRQYYARHMAVLQRPENDPSDIKNYIRHPAADGNKGWLEYKPLKGVV